VVCMGVSFVFLLSIELHAAVITGRIVDCDTREGIPGVSYAAFNRDGRKMVVKVYEGRKQYSYICDANGDYTIKDVPPGVVTLYFEAISYHRNPIFFFDKGRYTQRVVQLEQRQKLTLNLCLKKRQK